VSATVLSRPNGAGWYTTAPTVHFTCTDATSGVATCPADITVTTDGAGQEITGTAADRAGNTATTTVRLDIDRTAPGVSATVLSRPNGAGWYTTAPTVHFTCTDAGSGVATCPADTTVTTDGAGQQVSGSAKDKAGNTGSGTVPVSVDRSAPVVTVAGATDGTVYGPDAAPAVSCATTDKASGVATAATMTHVSNRDRHTVTCSGAVDKAANTAAPVQVSYSVKPTTAWLIALTRQYASKASASTLKQLEKDLTAGRITAYTSRVLSLSQGAKPVVTPPQAGTLVVWAASLCLFP
jgi:hypothetical protein